MGGSLIGGFLYSPAIVKLCESSQQSWGFIGDYYTLRKNEAQVELYIDRGKDQDEENRAIFDKLFNNKEEIEKSFGSQLEWERLEGKRACRIRKRIKIGGYRDDEEKWPQIHKAMVDDMMRLEEALKPYIKRLSI